MSFPVSLVHAARFRFVASTFVLCLLQLSMTSRASAFCRESLESRAGGDCVEEPGVPFLTWKRGCMTYRFNDNFFSLIPLLSETAIRQTFNASFDAWSAIDCGGRKPFFALQASKPTTTSAAEFLYDAVNESIVAARTKTEWGKLKDHDDSALALTLLWHDKATGEILDVDMELNTGAGRFNDCEKIHCGANMLDLQNTVTHEAGHLLGLGHSEVLGATMEPSTNSNPETLKRSLEADDTAGYCALKLPEWKCSGENCTCPAPPVVPSRMTVRTCGCRILGVSTDASLPWLAVTSVLALVLWRSRRRHTRPPSKLGPATHLVVNHEGQPISVAPSATRHAPKI